MVAHLVFASCLDAAHPDRSRQVSTSEEAWWRRDARDSRRVGIQRRQYDRDRGARHAKAIKLRYFVGLTLEEAAQVLGTSAPTVMRDLRIALAWLAHDMG